MASAAQGKVAGDQWRPPGLTVCSSRQNSCREAVFCLFVFCNCTRSLKSMRSLSYHCSFQVGSFDPYSDDPRLGIQKIFLCKYSGYLAIAGTAGQVIEVCIKMIFA